MRTVANKLGLAVKGQPVTYQGKTYKVAGYSGGMVTLAGDETLAVPMGETQIEVSETNALSLLHQLSFHLKARHPSKVFGYKPSCLGLMWMKHPFGWQFVMGSQQSVFAQSNPGQVDVWINVTTMPPNLSPLDALAFTLRFLGDQ